MNTEPSNRSLRYIENSQRYICLRNIEECQRCIDQWKKTIMLLQKQEDAIELEKQREPPKPRFGDIVVWNRPEKNRRIWLYDLHGSLGAFNKNGLCVGTSFPGYAPTGINIFESGLLKLDV